jgi:hypothetical protein
MSKAKTIKITNPVTGTVYEVRKRTTKQGIRGTVIGKWKDRKRDK